MLEGLVPTSQEMPVFCIDPAIPIGPQVLPFYGLYEESYKVIPKKRNYLGAYGYPCACGARRNGGGHFLGKAMAYKDSLAAFRYCLHT